MPLFAETRPRFLAKGGRSPQPQGEGSQGRTEWEGAGLHKRSAEDRRNPRRPPVGLVLDGSGDVPPKSGSCEKHDFSHREMSLEGRRPQRKGVGRERKLIANAIAATSGAWEHPTAKRMRQNQQCLTSLERGCT